MKKCILFFVLLVLSLTGINAGPTKIVKDAQPAQNWWMCSEYTGYDSCIAGDKIYLHGNGFENFCYVYLKGSQSGFVTVNSVKPGEITFIAPTWPVGTYDVWLHNNGSWAKFDSQLTISTKQALGLNYDATVIEAPAPSGGDDWQVLQDLCHNANPQNDQTGGPPNTLQLQAGTYKLSKPLLGIGRWGAVVAIKGQGRDQTILQLSNDITDVNTVFVRTESISSLKVDVGNFQMPNGPAVGAFRIVDCDIFSRNGQNCVFTDGGGTQRMYVVNCNITGCGIFCNGLKSGFITNSNFYLDGYTESALFLWSINNVHATNLTTREYKEYNGQRGRIFCGAYDCKNIYLENLQTFKLAGTNIDYNCGEQILFDGDPLKNVTMNLYVYNCKMQGKAEILDGASCGMEIYNAAVNCYVNGLTVDHCASAMNFLGTQLNCKFQNIKATNCRTTIRAFVPTTIYNLTATGVVDKGVWLADNNTVGNTSNLTLIDSVIHDAPIGVGSQSPGSGAGTLNLINSRIYAGKSPVTGLDAKTAVTLQGYSGIFSYPIKNVIQPRPGAPK